MKIYPKHGEKIGITLRRFRKQCDQAGITKEMKRIAYYEKPSEEKRRKLRKAIRTAQEELMEEKELQSGRPRSTPKTREEKRQPRRIQNDFTF